MLVCSCHTFHRILATKLWPEKYFHMLEGVNQVHGTPGNPAGLPENDSMYQFSCSKLSILREFDEMSHFWDEFGGKSAIGIIFFRPKPCSRITWHSWKLCRINHEPHFGVTPIRFRPQREMVHGCYLKSTLSIHYSAVPPPMPRRHGSSSVETIF